MKWNENNEEASTSDENNKNKLSSQKISSLIAARGKYERTMAGVYDGLT